jgi:hypothetical protein
MTQHYTYRGDRMTDASVKGATVTLVRRPDGQCVRGRNGNILAVVDGRRVVVLARQLRKIPPPPRRQPVDDGRDRC